MGRAYPAAACFPPGGWTKTSTGFVLVTDRQRIRPMISLAPRRRIAKTYEGAAGRAPHAGDGGWFRGGRPAGGRAAASANGAFAPGADGRLQTRVWCCAKGVYHQIKRMFGVYGAGVNELRRAAIGGLALDAALGAGGFRELSPAEVARLSSAAENRKKFRAKCWKPAFSARYS